MDEPIMTMELFCGQIPQTNHPPSISLTRDGDIYLNAALTCRMPEAVTHVQLWYDQAVHLLHLVPCLPADPGAVKTCKPGKHGLQVTCRMAFRYWGWKLAQRTSCPAKWVNERVEADLSGLPSPAAAAEPPPQRDRESSRDQAKTTALDTAIEHEDAPAEINQKSKIKNQTSNPPPAHEPGSPCCLNCKGYKKPIGIHDYICQMEGSPYKSQPTAARHLCNSYKPWRAAEGALPVPRVMHCSTEPERKWGPNDPRRGKRPRVLCCVCHKEFAAGAGKPFPHDDMGTCYTGHQGVRAKPCPGNGRPGLPLDNPD
jgi:hypothetical protein